MTIPKSKIKTTAQIEAQNRELGKRATQLGILEEAEFADFNKEEYLRLSSPDVLKAIKKAALHGNANAQKLWAQLAGILVEKSEIKVELSANDHYRIWKEAKRRLAEFETGLERNRDSDGDRGVQSQPEVLPDEVCVDREQEHREDSQVATLALSS